MEFEVERAAFQKRNRLERLFLWSLKKKEPLFKKETA